MKCFKKTQTSQSLIEGIAFECFAPLLKESLKENFNENFIVLERIKVRYFKVIFNECF